MQIRHILMQLCKNLTPSEGILNYPLLHTRIFKIYPNSKRTETQKHKKKNLEFGGY